MINIFRGYNLIIKRNGVLQNAMKYVTLVKTKTVQNYLFIDRFINGGRKYMIIRRKTMKHINRDEKSPLTGLFSFFLLFFNIQLD